MSKFAKKWKQADYVVEPTGKEVRHLLSAALHYESIRRVLMGNNVPEGTFRRVAQLPDRGIDDEEPHVLGALAFVTTNTTSPPGTPEFAAEARAKIEPAVKFLVDKGYADEDDIPAMKKAVKSALAHPERYSEVVAAALIPKFVSWAWAKEFTGGPNGRVPLPADLRVWAAAMEAATQKTKPLRSLASRLLEIEGQVEKERGKAVVGLKTGVVKWDEMLRGVSGFGVIGGRAGSGKSSKLVELVSGILNFRDENDACVVYLSADMPTRDIQRHFLCYLGNMSSVRYLMGTPAVLPHLEGSTSEYHKTTYAKGSKFSVEDNAKLKKALNTVSKWGTDLCVLGTDDGQQITSDMMMRSVEQARKQSGRSNCLLVIDYLQLIAAPDGMSEIQSDEHKVAEIMRVVSSGAAHVLAISETRKPDRQQEWGTDVADLKGAARLGYAPDWVAMLKEMTPTEALGYYVVEPGTKAEMLAAVEEKLRTLEAHTDDALQRAPRVMAVVKARGARSRGKWAEEFFFRTGRFGSIKPE